MRGVCGTILTVMHQTLLIAAQSALNALLKDIVPSLGRNNHPWDIFQAQGRSEIYCYLYDHVLRSKTTLRVVCECTQHLSADYIA